MKKTLFLILLTISLLAIPAFGDEQAAAKAVGEGQQTQPAPKPAGEDIVTKTYTLHFVSPGFVQAALRVYFYNSSYNYSSNLITVVIPKKNVAEFEEQLRKLDVEKKTIMLRVFTVIASKENKTGNIDNKDLKRVLSEVSNLLNFKSYTLDGVSAISVKDGTRIGNLQLSSDSIDNLKFDIRDISIVTSSVGKRSIKFEFNLSGLIAQSPVGGVTPNSQMTTLIQSETEIAESGYLVAGVSKTGKNGDALVLVINAEIK